ncbi:GtrA family protein [Vibrio cholerae]|uniref:GtrA family protein n=1 Tax=Vibrio cholerae TaxID=666 RepID=UPI0011D38E1E|nr:GtrA family protein [Vibrio cholerae]TXY76636.1 GtrA family protein [Vibrio cholerae]BCN21221.1 hypothetical protein [Vibrio cholerae]BCN21884.1 hypothetical protein [Vibrio cholerae]GHX91985.1 hypothetical protein VCSRO67_2407 [Vibrio cholerae]
MNIFKWKYYILNNDCVSVLILKYKQPIVFAIVGVINTSLHASILIFLVESFLLSSTAANFVAFGLANIFSYVANSKYTFNRPLSVKKYIAFFSASLISLALTLMISFLSNMYGLHYLFGFFLIVIFVPLLNFIALKIFIFKA